MTNKYQDVGDLRALYGNSNQIALRGHFLKKYSVREMSLHEYVLREIEDTKQDIKSILDIGAGTGSMLRKLHDRNPNPTYTALDIAPNQALMDQNSIEYVLYDGVTLPDFGHTFDAILMMHMLYHVANIPAFLAKVKDQYASDESRIFITTKSRETMPHMERLFRQALAQSGVAYPFSANRDEAQFCIENADEMLSSAFADRTVRPRVITTKLVVDSAEDLFAYMLSTPRFNLKESADRYVYEQELRTVIAASIPFEDSYTEALYVISN